MSPKTTDDGQESKTLTVAVAAIALFMDYVETFMLISIIPCILLERQVASQSSFGNASRNIHNFTDSSVDGHVDAVLISDVESNFTSSETQLDEENANSYLSLAGYIGIILLTKPVVETILNVPVGYFVDVCGHKYPLLIGSLFDIIANIGFAVGGTFEQLLVSRALQGIGGSLSTVAALALISSSFPDPSERAGATSVAFVAMGIGQMVGNPLGAFLYTFFGRLVTFFIVVILIAINTILRLFVPTIVSHDVEHRALSSYFRPLKDIYILLGLACVFVACVCSTAALTIQSAWFMDVFSVPVYKVAIILSAGTIAFIVFSHIAGRLHGKFDGAAICAVANVISAVAMVAFPMISHFWLELLPQMMYEAGTGLFVTTITQVLGHIMEVRLEPDHGILYGMFMMSFNLACVTGEAAAGAMMGIISAEWLYRAMCVMHVLLVIPCLLLRRVDNGRTGKQQGLSEKSAIVSSG